MAQFVPFLSDKSRHVRIRRRQITDLGEQPHYHDCYQILYVEQGRMLHQTVSLRPGDCFIVPPGYVHHTRADSKDLCYCSLTFRQALFSPGFVTSPAYEFLDKLRLTERDARLRIRLPRPEQEKLSLLLAALMAECGADYDPQTTMAGHLVAAVLRILARCHKPEADVPTGDPIAACMRYVDANYMLPLTPDTLARQFAISRSVLMEQFPKTAGMPVKQYLHHRRIHQAKKLLKTGISIREVAALVGYEDFSTFYRNFKKRTGQTPTQYKNA